MCPFMEELTSSPPCPSMGETTQPPHLSIEETPQPLNFSMEETSSPPNLSTGEAPPPLNLSMDETPLPPNLCMQKNPPPSTNSFMEETPPPSTNSSMGETSPSYTDCSLGEASSRQSTNSPMEETSVQSTDCSMEATSSPSAPRIVVIPRPLIARGVVMEPMFTIPRRVGPTRWSTSLFGCCSDVDNCCMTCFCPCVTFGQIAEIIDGGSSSCGGNGACYAGIMCLAGCQCLYSCFYRSKMRGQFFLEESPCVDCCVHCCCEPCALCQEYRELRNRGLDPQFGWNGNLVRQMAMIHPSVVPGMTR